MRVAAGVILFVASAYFLGGGLRNCVRIRIRALETAVAVLRHAEQKISIFGDPADRLFADVTGVDARWQTDIRQGNFQNLLRDMQEDAPLFEECLRTMRSACKTEVLQRCRYNLSVLEERQKRYDGVYQSQKRLYTVLPLLSAIAVLLLIE